MFQHIYIYIYSNNQQYVEAGPQYVEAGSTFLKQVHNMLQAKVHNILKQNAVAIFYPFSQFCEINISLLSLQKQPNTAPNLFQRGVEYGKYDYI